MSERLPQLSSLELISALQRAEFRIVRQKAVVRMQHMDGRVTTIPVHSGRTIGRGLLRKILRDTELSRENLGICFELEICLCWACHQSLGGDQTVWNYGFIGAY